MKKLFPKHLVLQCGVFVAKSTISLSTVTLVTRYASCQLKSEKQSNYPYKEFPFVHRQRSFHVILNIITACVEFKVKQDPMEIRWLDLIRNYLLF
jgi:hypothetical protein